MTLRPSIRTASITAVLSITAIAYYLTLKSAYSFGELYLLLFSWVSVTAISIVCWFLCRSFKPLGVSLLLILVMSMYFTGKFAVALSGYSESIGEYQRISSTYQWGKVTEDYCGIIRISVPSGSRTLSHLRYFENETGIRLYKTQEEGDLIVLSTVVTSSDIGEIKNVSRDMGWDVSYFNLSSICRRGKLEKGYNKTLVELWISPWNEAVLSNRLSRTSRVLASWVFIVSLGTLLIIISRDSS
ncbi:hypothetical protein [Thermococcus sp. MAR1]|uniref:hypothetical protein n=1 Tax=Thermococcus sp. MAR1 TaxID=1638263 RepID=UPI0014391BBC|nr:hypothetical protein [Thermococcus sp. MAR1]NJE09832.1 hypothetical protein [Thermococcus sp. MAR1]